MSDNPFDPSAWQAIDGFGLTDITYHRHVVDGERYVVNGYPGADWVHNVRAADEATLTKGRHSERVRMVEVPPEDARPVLRVFPEFAPSGVDIMKRSGVLTAGTPDELEALAGRLPVFRIDRIT